MDYWQAERAFFAWIVFWLFWGGEGGEWVKRRAETSPFLVLNLYKLTKPPKQLTLAASSLSIAIRRLLQSQSSCSFAIFVDEIHLLNFVSHLLQARSLQALLASIRRRIDGIFSNVSVTGLPFSNSRGPMFFLDTSTVNFMILQEKRKRISWNISKYYLTRKRGVITGSSPAHFQQEFGLPLGFAVIIFSWPLPWDILSLLSKFFPSSLGN